MAGGLRILVLLALAAVSVLASEAAGGHGGGDPFLGKKFFNFALLSAGLIYIFVKSVFPLLRAQQKAIRDGLNQASRKAEQAAARAAEIESRMAGLEAEVNAMRDEMEREMEAEAERFRRETASRLEKIELHAEQEISSAVKFARQELRAYASNLALELARRRISAVLDDEAQGRIVSAFNSQLGSSQADRN